MQNKIAVPTHSECMALLSKYEMPENIVAHCIEVSKIAVFIAERIKARGGKVNVPLVRAGALLHDIDKIIEIKNKAGKHGLMAREILEKEGYPEVAKIAERHVLYKILEKGAKFSIEEKIVFYSDKRVNHDKIVPLGERFEYFRKKYPQYLDSINLAEPSIKELEKELMDAAGMSSDEVKNDSIINQNTMISAANMCLLVIDMQNDFLEPKGYYGTKKDISPMIKTKENLDNFIKKAIGKIPIVFIQAEYEPNQFGAGKFICLKDSWGQEIVFDKKYADKIIKKHAHSAFSNDELKKYLKGKRIDTLLISGVTIENCVRATSIDSIKNGFKTILFEDCVGTDKERLENKQKVFDELKETGVIIVKSESIVF